MRRSNRVLMMPSNVKVSRTLWQGAASCKIFHCGSRRLAAGCRPPLICYAWASWGAWTQGYRRGASGGSLGAHLGPKASAPTASFRTLVLSGNLGHTAAGQRLTCNGRQTDGGSRPSNWRGARLAPCLSPGRALRSPGDASGCAQSSHATQTDSASGSGSRTPFTAACGIT